MGDVTRYKCLTKVSIGGEILSETQELNEVVKYGYRVPYNTCTEQ